MHQLLQALCADTPSRPPVSLLADLITALRPTSPTDTATAISHLHALAFLLEKHPDYRAGLRRTLRQLLTEQRQVQLYTDTGLLANETFGQTIRRRLGQRLLPPARSDNHLADQFGLLFHHSRDHQWLQRIPSTVWLAVWQAMHWEEDAPEAASPVRMELLEAVQVLTARITAIGLEPELVRAYPDIERFASPFLHLSAEATRYVEAARWHPRGPTPPEEDHRQLLILLEQCEQLIQRQHKVANARGISVSLTYHLRRLSQHTGRLRTLLHLLEGGDDAVRDGTLFALLIELVRADNRRFSVRDVFTTNIELLARQVTEHAGRHGEHYICDTRSQWLDMARAAMGAGLIVGFMALCKLWLGKLHLPLIWEAVAFGLNYALGFMLIHVLHFTIATKQPAMTAARLAAAIEAAGDKAGISALAELMARVARTQLVAILGNVLVAIPVAWLIAAGWQALTGSHLISTDKAAHLLHDQHPLDSPALLHAAIAGVYLFLAGLIAGYYDNLAIYRQIPQRLAALPWLNRLLGPQRTGRLAAYVAHNLGGLAGNFYFGLLLGITGTLGYLLGLPLDIRHITFSSAYLSYASVAYDYQLPLSTLLWATGGVVLIGLTNLLVSFTLALWVALRSRQLKGSDALPLLPTVARHFCRHPREFFLPPRDPD